MLIDIDQVEGATEKEIERIRQYKIQSLSNILACMLRLQIYADAVPAADEILKLDPGN